MSDSWWPHGPSWAVTLQGSGTCPWGRGERQHLLLSFLSLVHSGRLTQLPWRSHTSQNTWVKRPWINESLGRWNWAETPLGISRGNKICSLERGGAEGRAVWRGARPDLGDHTDVVTRVNESGRWLFEMQDFC